MSAAIAPPPSAALSALPNLTDYASFIEAKSHLSGEFGFKASFQHPQAFDFQTHLIDFATTQGRAAIYADCGLGKTLMQLTWAHNVNRHANKPVLILAPLSVSRQTVGEAEKFDLSAVRSLDGTIPPSTEIVTTNYERLHHFDPDAFAGVVCDESSVIKNFDGARKGAITEFMKRVRYRLLCSATPSPNDYVELGTSSEALGYLGHMDMLGMFFRNDEDSLHPAFAKSKWRFKHHAEGEFWRYLCSFARAVRKPSDLGYEDGRFVLPDLIEVEHVIKSVAPAGHMFPVPASNLAEERAERRSSLRARCEKAAEILSTAQAGVGWCHLNDEADLLTEMVAGAVQVSGADPDERKEEIFEGFRLGQITRLITKPKIAAFGMNWQHCDQHTYFADHSFEQYYQAIRRSHRFGRSGSFTAHTITTEALGSMTANMRRKAKACDAMFAEMVTRMNDALRVRPFRPHAKPQELPTWL